MPSAPRYSAFEVGWRYRKNPGRLAAMEKDHTTTDNRSKQQRRIYKAGKIVFGLRCGIDATVRNISDTGALLQVESVLDILNELLVINAEGLKRQCKIAWRRPTALGVRFV